MSGFRLRSVLFTLTIGLWLTLGAHGRGQTSGLAREMIDQAGLPAIERGISPVPSVAPTSSDGRRYSAHLRSGTFDRVSSSGVRYAPGRVIVKFRDGVGAELKKSIAATASPSAGIAQHPAYADFDIVTIDPNEDAEAVSSSFRQRSDVEYAQPAYRVYPTLVPNDKFYPLQWNLPMIGLERAWDIQPSAGSSITVAVIDTGIAYTTMRVAFTAIGFKVDDSGNLFPDSPQFPGTSYPALGQIIVPFVAATELATANRFVAPWDFIWGDNLPLDLEGHGTHVTGTIGQLTNNGTNGIGDTANGGGTAGVAFNVKIMPVKVLSNGWDEIFGSPNVGTDDIVAQGVRYAADNGANVINMSLGRPGPDPSPVMESAIKYAVGKGVFIAIAAGNYYEEGNPISIPAEIATRVNGAVSVAAVDRTMNHAYYSSTGSWVELAAPGGSQRGFPPEGGILQQTVDGDRLENYPFFPSVSPAQFAAPRADVLDYEFFQGTSMASPHVAGAAAMLMQQGIRDPAAIEAALEKFAVDLGDPGRDPIFGYGLIDVRSALRGLGLAR
ncbi:MAG TPA: S8 family serine peptidase [Vicinamibacterales bacterium]|nr:S8 family serine peptidase [Vicinamibacterales bacterium]